MGSFSLFHWLIVGIDLVALSALGWAVARILRRLGLSRWWTTLAFVPLLNIVGLVALARADWHPAER